MVDVGFGRGPRLRPFLETNVRLYSVDDTGRRGVVFLSLDADQVAVVAAGRGGLRAALPVGPDAAAVLRRRPRATPPGCAGPEPGAGSRLVRAGRPRPGCDGPLERFLTARWGLHVSHLGRTWYLPNTHEPWSLRAAAVLVLGRPPARPVGLAELAGRAPDHVAFSPGVRVAFGRPVLASSPRPR